MSTTLTQWLDSSMCRLGGHRRSDFLRDPLLMLGGIVIAAAFIWPAIFLGILLVFYGSHI